MSGYPHQCIDTRSNSNLDFLAIRFFIIKYYTVEIHHKDCNFQNAELKRLNSLQLNTELSRLVRCMGQAALLDELAPPSDQFV